MDASKTTDCRNFVCIDLLLGKQTPGNNQENNQNSHRGNPLVLLCSKSRYFWSQHTAIRSSSRSREKGEESILQSAKSHPKPNNQRWLEITKSDRQKTRKHISQIKQEFETKDCKDSFCWSKEGLEERCLGSPGSLWGRSASLASSKSQWLARLVLSAGQLYLFLSFWTADQN